LSVDFLG